MSHESDIESSRGVLRVLPENNWRDVWHDAPCRGIMKRLPKFRDLPDGGRLRLCECMTCGTRMYAGLNGDRRVVCQEVE